MTGNECHEGVRTKEQIIAAPDTHITDAALCRRVVYFKAAILCIANEGIPVFEYVVERFGKLGLLFRLSWLLDHPGAQCVERWHGVLLTHLQPHVSRLTVDRVFNAIQCTNAIERLFGCRA